MALHRLAYRIGIDVGHIGQLVLGDQPDAGDVEQRKDLGGRAAGQLIKVVDIVRAGAAGINHRGHAGSNADAVWLVVVNR